jgi:hypothetical protein
MYSGSNKNRFGVHANVRETQILPSTSTGAVTDPVGSPQIEGVVRTMGMARTIRETTLKDSVGPPEIEGTLRQEGEEAKADVVAKQKVVSDRGLPVKPREGLPGHDVVALDPADPENWQTLCSIVLATDLPGKVSKTHVRSTLGLLKGTLVAMYGRADITKLIADADTAACRVKFSVVATNVAANLGWAKSTAQKFFGILRKIMGVTTINTNFVRTIKLLTAERERNAVLGGKYGRRHKDDPARILLENWAGKLRINTKMRSDLSLKNVMNFIISVCLPAFDLNPESYQESSKDQIEAKISDELVKKICGELASKGKKCCWLQAFLTFAVGSTYVITKELRKSLDGGLSVHGQVAPPGDGSDHHRISAENLDKIYDASTGKILHELTFLLMITTGVRIGGVAHIRTANVARDTGKLWKVISDSQTLCKGPKWYGFPLVPRTQKLIGKWLDKYRPADPSPYLFPGICGGHVSTATIRGYFNQTCKLAGLDGKEMHPHALRHSYAHLVLGAGNSLEIVAKLMNHTNSAVTENSYLKESATEVVNRANIPWIKKDNATKRKRDEEVPGFLLKMNNTKADEQKKKTNQKRRKEAHSSLAMFKPLDNL